MRLDIDDERAEFLYREYLAQREASKRNIKKLGGEARETYVSTKAEFLSDLKSARFDDRKSSYKNLAKQIARDEIYPESSLKSIAAAKAHAKLFGVEYSPALVQAYRSKVEYKGEVIWSDVSALYHSARSSGETVKEAKKLIANTFFGGSPK